MNINGRSEIKRGDVLMGADLFAVIMAGGAGTRFWPASRKLRPKQFLTITGPDPMVVETCNRLSGLVADEKVVLVLGVEHLSEATRLFEGRSVHLLGEPVGRNTAPCIGLGALYAKHQGHKGAIAFLPADHYIADRAAFVSSLETAASLALQGGIVTLGIVPTRPETGYGYIKRKEGKGADAPYYEVEAFVEKPDLERAKQYLRSGKYFWNAGIFVATADTILHEITTHLPWLREGLDVISRALELGNIEDALASVYPELESVSFDYGIMEKTKGAVYVVPSECGWSDVGTWLSLYELRSKDQDPSGNVAEGDTLLIDCERNFISAKAGRLVACLGVENILVVDTEDALLVADLRRSQEIRDIVEELKKSGKEELL